MSYVCKCIGRIYVEFHRSFALKILCLSGFHRSLIDIISRFGTFGYSSAAPYRNASGTG
jgi:hypothetical protein